MKRVTVGVIGCGNISPAYLGNITKHFSSILDLRAVADLNTELAQKRATEFSVPRVCTVPELLADRDIELILNLTPFIAHYEVSMQVLNAGKHLFTEKALAVTREQGREIIEAARLKGLVVAGASDTFLCAGMQACRKAIDDGEIGPPAMATTMITMPGRSDRYLNIFGGAMFDMMPYYLGGLVALLGPITRVAAVAHTSSAELPYPDNHPKAGQTFKVSRPTTVCGTVAFASRTVATVTASVDACSYFPRNEIYGPKATLVIGDPNGYKAVSHLRFKDGTTCDLPMEGGFKEDGRALGVAEMAVALRQGRKPRASGELMYHLLDVFHAFHESALSGTHLDIESTCDKPAAFDYGEMMKAV